MIVVCPVCERDVQRGAFAARSISEGECGSIARCVCGYDFATDDRRSSTLRARHDSALAGRWITRGFALLAVSPLLIFIGAPIFGAAAAFWYAAPVIAAGFMSGITGVMRHARAQRMLSRANSPMPLPEARVVEP